MHYIFAPTLEKGAKIIKSDKSRDHKKASYEAENLWKNRLEFSLFTPEIWASINMWVPSQFDVEVCESGTFRFELWRNKYM
jgi:hypothetical protein